MSYLAVLLVLACVAGSILIDARKVKVQLAHPAARNATASSNAPAGNSTKKFPPNSHKPLTDAEVAMHPKYRVYASKRAVLPATFDARVQWPNCVSIKTIRNQGQCGTCWAVSGASVLSDRICITSGQTTNIYISANQGASCPTPQNTGSQNCLNGGDASTVYKYSALLGLPTGGEYESGIGCVPYPVSPSGDPPLTCQTSCTNSAYSTLLANDKHIVDSYYLTYLPSAMSAPYTMAQSAINTVVQQMKTDIVANGPLTAILDVYQDFETWTPSLGAYKGPAANSPYMGGHQAKIIGWNSDSNGVPYWMISNSWGADVGNDGIYWMEMGANVVGIESGIGAPIVTIPNTCTGASFCSSAINMAVSTNIENPNAPIYLFQGNCVQQVSVSGTKYAAVGAPQPLGKILVGSPAGPIIGNMISSGLLWVWNAAGQAGGCAVGTGLSKFICADGSVGGFSTTEVGTSYFNGTSTPVAFSYDPSVGNYLTTNTGSVSLGTTFSAYFTTVTAMLNLNGSSMLVFGTNSAGSPIIGTLSYPVGGTGAVSWLVTPGAPSNLLTCSSP